MTQSSFAQNLKKDIPASFVVALVALPLCLGIALASGAPLVSGLIAGIVGGIIVGSISRSALGVSGPAAGLAAIVLTAIADLGSFEIFLVAVVLGGAIQFALGVARAGIIAYYFPSAVIKGMLAGIGIIIFLKQLPHAFGYDKDPVGEMSFNQPDGETTLSELHHLLDPLSAGPVIVAAISLAILLLWETRKLKSLPILPLIPGPLLAVATGIGLTIWFESYEALRMSADHLVKVPIAKDFSGMKEFFTLPDFAGLTHPGVYKTAIVLAIVASLETLLCVEAADKLDTEKRITPTNLELKAQGIGNMVSGLIGGLPVTQVIVRSSANFQSGAKSRASTILHGVLLAGSILLIPNVMNLIPLATLAAILLVVGYKLARPSLFINMYKRGFGQFAPFIVTVLGIAFTDLLIGIGLGLHVAVILILFESYRLPFNIKNVRRGEGEQIRVQLSQQVTFLNKASVLKTLDSIPRNSIVEIDASHSAFIHPDVVEIIEDYKSNAESKNIQVTVLGLEPERREQLQDEMSVEVEFPNQTISQ